MPSAIVASPTSHGTKGLPDSPGSQGQGPPSPPKRWKRRLLVFLGSIGLAVATVVTGVALWLALLDPTAYRDDIARWLSQTVGREITISGGAHVAVYPWLGLYLGDLAIAEHGETTTSAPPFATSRGAVIKVRLKPLLLDGALELDDIVLIDPTLHLTRTAQGTTNWDDLLQLGSEPQAPQSSGGDDAGMLQSMRWGGLSIANGTLVYTDDQAGEGVVLSHLHCITGEGAAFDVSLQGYIVSSHLGGEGALDLQGRVALDPVSHALRLQRAQVAFTGVAQPRVAALPAPISLALNGGIVYDGEALTVSNMQLTAAGMSVQLDATLSGLASGVFGVRGTIGNQPRQAEPSGATPAPPAWWQALQWKAAFDASEQGLRLSNLHIRKGESSLAGSASLQWNATPAVTLRLQSPWLDWNDLHFGDAVMDEAAWDALLASLAEGTIPEMPDFLQGVPVQADIALQTLQVDAQTMKGVNATASLQQDGLRLDATVERACEGQLSLQGRLDAKGAQLQAITSPMALHQCPLLEVVPKNVPWQAQGTMAFRGNATAPGHSLATWKRRWRVQGEASFADGQLDMQEIESWFADDVTAEAATYGHFQRLVVDGVVTPAGDITQSRLPLKGDVTLTTTKFAVEPKQRADGSLHIKGAAVFDTNRGELAALQQIAVGVQAALPKGMLGKPATKATAQATISYDRGKDRLDIAGATITAHGMTLKANVVGTSLSGTPQVQGKASLQPTTAKALLAVFGEAPPKTKDERVLQNVAMTTSWKREGRKVVLPDMALALDSTAINGSVSFSLSKQGMWKRPGDWSFNLTADRLDLDRYLEPDPPPGTAPKDPAAPVKPWDASFMDSLDLNGLFFVKSLTFYNIHYQDVALQVDGKPGQLRFDPCTAKVADGSLHATMALLQPQQGIGLDMLFSGQVKRFRLEGVAQAFGSDRVGGITDLTLNLRSSGATADAHLQSFTGDAAMVVRNGFYAYTKTVVEEAPEEQERLIQRQNPAPAPTVRKERAVIDVASATATFTIGDSRVRNNDFRMNSSQFTATGKGWLDFVRSTVDYALWVDAQVIPPFPILIRGPLNNPMVDDSQGGSLGGALGELTGDLFRTFLDVLTLPFRTLEGVAKQRRPLRQ